MLTWLSSLANELKIPMKKKATLKIDNKISTKYHDGEIIQDNQNDLHLLVDNKAHLILHTVTDHQSERNT